MTPPVPLDVEAVAALFGVKRTTVWQWRQRNVLPAPDGYISDKPWWWPSTISQFATDQPTLGRHRPKGP